MRPGLDGSYEALFHRVDSARFRLILRGNVVDLAVAVVIGTAFTALVAAFTTSFLEPLIGLIGGGGENGGELVVNGQHFTWGAFVNAVITFVLTAAVVYLMVVLPMAAREVVFA